MELLDGRYALHERLGSGGTGTVFRATDRLTGDVVALKQVTISAAALKLTEPGESDWPVRAPDPQLMLAHEFQLLATLHHPHIVRVLEYGFDRERRPYFTMAFLEGARTIVAAADQTPIEQAELLIQLLQALSYLHLRGLIHRDLKPANVLIHQGTVRVLDFGLSATRPEPGAAGSTLPTGTLAYMAPEVITGHPPTEAADLYAVGVIAYRLAAGHHPFPLEDTTRLIQDILYREPDMAQLPVGHPLRPLIARLLAKDPAHRFPDTSTTLEALETAMSLPPGESAAVRDSFFQAARFVGRKTELGQLTEALDRAQTGQGGLWLIGGESGVGKTRLLEELRIRALVKGVLVLQGQAVREGGPPYQLWLEPLRRLLLRDGADDQTAAVLRHIVPDIDQLVGRPAPDVPQLSGAAGQQRLHTAIVSLFRSCSSPIVLLLEDLQWVKESGAVLARLAPLTAELPLLLVASYRTDEGVDLPPLPRARQLLLDRLSPDSVAELSEAMLGPAGRQPELLAWLKRETEGNAFFLVEVARLLAELAGHREQIGRLVDKLPPPEQVFPLGVRTVVRRRLDRVPMAARAFLDLAAVAGREMDLSLLTAVAASAGSSTSGETEDILAGMDLERWLETCESAAVLNFRDGGWRFSHDKLRLGVLERIGQDDRLKLHRQIALALTEVYGSDPRWAASQARHWGAAGALRQERLCAARAGAFAAANFAPLEALAHLTRALDLTPQDEPEDRFQLLLLREGVLDLLGRRDAQAADLAELEAVALILGDPGGLGTVALRQARMAEATGDPVQAIAAARQAIDLAADVTALRTRSYLQAAGHLNWGQALWHQEGRETARHHFHEALRQVETGLAVTDSAPPASNQTRLQPPVEELHRLHGLILLNLGGACLHEGDYACAIDYYRRSAEVSGQLGDRPGQARVLNNLGVVHFIRHDHEQAALHFTQALEVHRSAGNRQGEAIALTNLGEIAFIRGHLDQAKAHYDQALHIYRQIGYSHGEGSVLVNLGELGIVQGDFLVAAASLEQADAAYSSIGDRQGQGLVLLARAWQALAQEHWERGVSFSRQAADLFQDLDDRYQQIQALVRLGRCRVGQSRLDEAGEAFRHALALQRSLEAGASAAESLAGLAQVALREGDMVAAHGHVATILDTIGLPLLGLKEPTWIYRVCRQVLLAQNDLDGAERFAALIAGRPT